jgi:hypothetical protein
MSINRIAGHLKSMQDLLRLHLRPEPAQSSELFDLVNKAQPLDVYIPRTAVLRIVKENLAQLEANRAASDGDPLMKEINDALVMQRQQFLRALTALEGEHLFMSLFPVDAFGASDGDADGDAEDDGEDGDGNVPAAA